MPRLLVDISSHGFGHLAQAAPILCELLRKRPEIHLTVRSGLPEAVLRARLPATYEHLSGSSDFGYVMHDATRVDLRASGESYRAFHAEWERRVAGEGERIAALAPDLVLTDVAYLPLAGAATAGIPAVSMCSLNWADLFAAFYTEASWAAPIHRQIHSAYEQAECFLRLTPAMPMRDLSRVRSVGPVAAIGTCRRSELRDRLGCGPGERVVLAAFGGIDKAFPYADWPRRPGLRWLLPRKDLPPGRGDMTAIEAVEMTFSDLLCSVDALLTKPGYGAFVEAACSALPVLYLRRDDWPEQQPLIDWLRANARCQEVSAANLERGELGDVLNAVWHAPAPPRPSPDGVDEVVGFLSDRLA